MKAIRHNVPDRTDQKHFGETSGFTLHTDSVTVYFDSIKETAAGYTFTNSGVEVAFVGKSDCEISPLSAKDVAEDKPNEKVPFDD